MNFGVEVMKHEMKLRNWSQGELARRSGVDRTTICKICTGVNLPSVKLARVISKLLDIDWQLFFIPYEEGVELLELRGVSHESF